jgi:hypothetical protein
MRDRGMGHGEYFDGRNSFLVEMFMLDYVMFSLSSYQCPRRLLRLMTTPQQTLTVHPTMAVASLHTADGGCFPYLPQDVLVEKSIFGE